MEKKILIVDDNPVILKQMTTILEAEGYSVATAGSGLEALNMILSFVPDILFIDLIMPNISGDMLCRIIRTMPQFNNSYIIIFSAAVAEMGYNYRGIGADACIAKGPYKEMAKRIREVLKEVDGEKRQRDTGDINGKDSIQGRQITKELLSRRWHLERILENIPEGILELFSGQIVYANAAALRFLDLPIERVIGSKPMDLLPENVRPEIEQVLESDDTGSQSNGNNKPVTINEIQLVIRKLPLNGAPTSSIVVMTDVTQILAVDEEDRKVLEQLVDDCTKQLRNTNELFIREVSERKNIEEAKREAELQWENTFNVIDHSICMLDSEGRITRCNRATEKMKEQPFDRISGRFFWQVLYGTEAPLKNCPFARMKETKIQQLIHLQVKNKWFEVWIAPIIGEDGILMGAVHVMSSWKPFLEFIKEAQTEGHTVEQEFNIEEIMP